MNYKDEFVKARTKHLKLPSGIEIDYVLPSTGDLLQLASGEINAEQVVKIIAKGLPEGVQIEDLPIEDFAYLRDYLGDFFDKASKSTFQVGSENSQKQDLKTE